MDEHREEREELAALELEQRDDAREAAEARAYWQDTGLALVSGVAHGAAIHNNALSTTLAA